MTPTLSALSHLIASTYDLESTFRESTKMLARFARMQRFDHHGDPRHVAISTPQGSGNAVRRRLGQRAVFRADDGYHGPECESHATHTLTWIDRAGKTVAFLPSKPLSKRPKLPL